MNTKLKCVVLQGELVEVSLCLLLRLYGGAIMGSV